MHITALIIGLGALVSALPERRSVTPSNFFLVTTTQKTQTYQSSSLTNVSAISLFDPYYQTIDYLRLTAAGYQSLPRFNITNGDLHTVSYGPHGSGPYVYNSTGNVVASQQLQLSPTLEPNGNLALKHDYLLTVDGKQEGWTICVGQLSEQTVCGVAEQSMCCSYQLTDYRSRGRVLTPAARRHTFKRCHTRLTECGGRFDGKGLLEVTKVLTL